MRDIRFRAWDSQECAMYLWDDMLTFGGAYFKNVLRGRDGTMEVMQFTGLHDKNGKEIYEGDIFLNGESKRIIEFRGGNCHAITPDKTGTILLSFIINNPKNVVIGNIHENPELLEG